MALTKGAKKLGVSLLVAGALVGGYFYAAKNGYVPGEKVANMIMPKKVDLSGAAPLSNVKNVALMPFPSTSVNGSGAEYRIDEAAWASQHGLNYANGGAITTKGSIMESKGITNFRIIRQDNFDQQVNDLVAFATEWKKSGGNPKKGVQFISLMLDGAPSYMAALKEALTPLNLNPVIIGSVGKSHGEDGLWGPQKWIKDPKAMKGATVIGVLYDGDMNDPIKLANDNDVRINPDVKTYDPDALNIMAAEDYLKAVDMFRDGYKEEREVVRNGVKTGSKKTIKPDGIVTWTPGDVRIAKEIGGLYPIVTTEEYYWQMPEALITIAEWADANEAAVENILDAALTGGAQVKVHDKALYKACEISAKIWAGKGEEGKATYWYENFKRHEIADKKGNKVKVGGSMNFSIEDAVVAFNLSGADGGPAGSSYTVFGDEMARLWPSKMKSYPAFASVFNAKYLQAVAKRSNLNEDLTQKPSFDAAPIRETVSTSTKDVQFRVGSAELTALGASQVKKLYNEINTTGFKVMITGHADAQGTASQNMALSQKRAEAVKAYLISRGFPENRVNADWKGDTQPVDPAKTPAAYAKNRRVVIELGK